MSAIAELEASMQRLREVLGAETQALMRRDVTAAMALAEAKRGALDTFLAARAGVRTEELRPVASELGGLVEQLRQQVDENRTALEQAMVVQGRVMELLARAAERAANRDQGYGRPAAPAPLALSVRA